MQRVILILLAVLVSVPLILRNRTSGINTTRTVFSVMTSGSVVRISGDVSYSGIYRIFANQLPHSVINMAVPVKPFIHLQEDGNGKRFLRSGDDVRLKIFQDGSAFMTYSTMSARQRMLLGVHLDINLMSESDFDCLPGIGPAMAKRIVENRQISGGKMRLEDLVKVEGIGQKKLEKLRQYFQ